MSCSPRFQRKRGGSGVVEGAYVVASRGEGGWTGGQATQRLMSDLEKRGTKFEGSGNGTSAEIWPKEFVVLSDRVRGVMALAARRTGGRPAVRQDGRPHIRAEMLEFSVP